MAASRDGRLAPAEATRLRVWIKERYGTVQAFAEQHEYPPSYLSRVLGRKPDGGVGLGQLRELVGLTGHSLSQLFEEPVEQPRQLTLADVRVGLRQASVNFDRWATLLQTIERQEEPLSATPQGRQAIRAWDAEARAAEARAAAGRTKKRQGSRRQDEPDEASEPQPQLAGRQPGRRGR